jgi:hypothetical protein
MPSSLAPDVRSAKAVEEPPPAADQLFSPLLKSLWDEVTNTASRIRKVAVPMTS